MSGRRSDAGAVAARVAGVLGHELRNPLAAALTGASLLAELIDDGDPRRRVLDGVLSDLGRLSATLDAYLAFARGGRPTLANVPLQPLAAAVARTHGARVQARCGDVEVVGDAALLERVLGNLVENALQAGAATVTIGANDGGDGTVRVTVDDDGPGVPRALRHELFAPGVSGTGSTGLGLCIAAETVAAHGGTIRCVERPRGTRFLLTLPAAPVALHA